MVTRHYYSSIHPRTVEKHGSNVEPFYGAIIFLVLFYHRLRLLEQRSQQRTPYIHFQLLLICNLPVLMCYSCFTDVFTVKPFLPSAPFTVTVRLYLMCIVVKHFCSTVFRKVDPKRVQNIVHNKKKTQLSTASNIYD